MATLTHAHEGAISKRYPDGIAPPQRRKFDPLLPLRCWIDNWTIPSSGVAHLICRVIPCCCPFERDIILFSHTLFHIPPLCKLNPLYEECVSLRFRALSYLADDCGEDISQYICE